MAKRYTEGTKCVFEIGGRLINIAEMKEHEGLSMPLLQKALADESVQPFPCFTIEEAYAEYDSTDTTADSARAHAALQAIALLRYTTRRPAVAEVTSRDIAYT